jgi:glycopeptide antibiotics resistance protein
MGLVFCAPSELVDDPHEIKTRYEGFYSMPFAGLTGGSHLEAVLNALTKLLFFAPLGAFLALAVIPLPIPRPIRRILLAGLLLAVAGIGASIEMTQVFLRPHVPDITDVILYTAGAAGGMLVVTTNSSLCGSRADVV